MLSHTQIRSSTSHFRGVWGYLRLGIAICATFFVVSGLVSLAQHGFWGAIGAFSIGVVLLLLVVGVAAVIPKVGVSSPPASAESILARSFPPGQSEEARGGRAKTFDDQSTRVGPMAAYFWYWTQVARAVPFGAKGAVTITVGNAAVAMTKILHLISQLLMH